MAGVASIDWLRTEGIGSLLIWSWSIILIVDLDKDQLTFIYSNSTIEVLHKGAKYVQS